MKEIIAKKGKINSVYRLEGHDLYLKGIPSQQYYQLLANFKQKKALKSSIVKLGWIKLTFVDEIAEDELKTTFFNTMLLTLKNMGFICKVKEYN